MERSRGSYPEDRFISVLRGSKVVVEDKNHVDFNGRAFFALIS